MKALVYRGPADIGGDDVAEPVLLNPSAGRFTTHRFGFDRFIEAYDVFTRAAETGALKVVLSRDS
jgi:hypothetical protein